MAPALVSRHNSHTDRRRGEIYIINQNRTWEKLLLGAQTIIAMENSADVRVIFSRNTGHWNVLKISATIGAIPIAGLFIPRLFVNLIQATFQEPGEKKWWPCPLPSTPYRGSLYAQILVRNVNKPIRCSRRAPSAGEMGWMTAVAQPEVTDWSEEVATELVHWNRECQSSSFQLLRTLNELEHHRSVASCSANTEAN